MIETASVEAPEWLQRSPGLAERLRLHGDHQRIDLADILGRWIEANAFRHQCTDLGRRLRLDHRDARWIEPLREPAGQHRAAHLACSGQRDSAGDILKGAAGVHWCHHKFSGRSRECGDP
jgi:hypothetical protein